MFSTDTGADQLGCHNTIAAEMASSLTTLYFRQWCCLHQLALAVKSHLVVMGKHFSAVATMVNVWRSVNTAVKIREAPGMMYVIMLPFHW